MLELEQNDTCPNSSPHPHSFIAVGQNLKEKNKLNYGPSKYSTLECDIDHTVGLFGRFCLFHTCIDKKVHHVAYYSHLDSRVV